MTRAVTTGALVALAGVLWLIAAALLLRLVVDAVGQPYGTPLGVVLMVTAYGGFIGWWHHRDRTRRREDDD